MRRISSTDRAPAPLYDSEVSAGYLEWGTGLGGAVQLSCLMSSCESQRQRTNRCSQLNVGINEEEIVRLYTIFDQGLRKKASDLELMGSHHS